MRDVFAIYDIFSRCKPEERKFMVKLIDKHRLLVLSKEANVTVINLVGFKTKRYHHESDLIEMETKRHQYDILDSREMKASTKEILFNEENRHKFLFFGQKSAYSTVELTNENNIKLGKDTVKTGNLYWKKWEGQKIYGFLRINRHNVGYYCEFDMETKETIKTNVPLTLYNGKPIPKFNFVRLFLITTL